MVIALIALSVALGGSSYAATKLSARSVGSKELKKAGVARTNIKDNAVNSAKVADDSLTGRDILESSLGQVPSAALAARAAAADRTGLADRATTAGNADHANSSGGLDRIVYRTAQASVGAAPPDPSDPTQTLPVFATATATCDPGYLVTGGGVKVDDTELMGVEQDFPDANGRAWTGTVANDDDAARGFVVYAICVPAGAAG